MDAPARAATARYISVIVPTRNRCDLLAEALASVRAIERPDLELDLIVADNGSSDLTPDVARRYGARLVQTFVPGAAAARNAGLKAAKGEFIAFLDDDDVWLAGHLRPQLDVMEQNPDLAGVIGQVAVAVDREEVAAWPEASLQRTSGARANGSARPTARSDLGWSSSSTTRMVKATTPKNSHIIGPRH